MVGTTTTTMTRRVLSFVKRSELFLIGLFLVALPLLSEAAYNQGDEAQYLSNFDQTMPASYAAIDDNELAPSDLLLQCKDTGVVDFANAIEVIVQPDDPSTKTVTASSVQAQCGRDNATSSSPIICIVPAGIRLYTTSNLVVDAFIVRGELYWRDIDQSLLAGEHQWLCAGYVAVEDQGKFIMNVQTKTSWIYLMDNGAVHPIGQSRYFGGVAPHHNGADGTSTSTHHPVVDIKGRTLTRTWSLLSNPFRSGETTMTLLHSPVRMGWHIGDRIGIASTVSSSAGTGQTFQIVSMEGNTITVDDVANQNYRADFYPPTKLGQANTRDPYAAALLSAEVVNLSRNVIITGDDYRHVPCDSTLPEAVLGEQTSTEGCKCSSFRTQCTVGLHTAQMHAGTMSIRSTRVEKCGQRGIEGKYCLHFHKLRTCADCMFKDNVIEQSHQRGIIIHGTHLSTVSNNVLWDVRGASIYIEDGNEMYNHIKYNVVVCPWPFVDQIMHGCTVPGTSNTQADTANNQAGIYTETAANDLIGNRVANAFNSMFLQANGQGRGEAYGKVCTNHLQFGRWEGNTFHGALRFGTYTLGGSEPRKTDQSIINNGYNTDRVATCAAVDVDSGYDRGEPVSILNNVDYGNVFVGHYTAGDIQHRGHKSYNNNNLIYWKETKNFADGCGSHLMDAIYEEGTMALPDQSTFIIQDTIFGKNVQLEANHHCNVGTTGFLCMPQYILHNVQWKGTGNGRWTWLQRGGTGGGGIFSLSPPDAQRIMSATPQEQSTMQDLLFPPGFVSVASGHFSSLLLGDAGATTAAGPYCISSTALGSIEATRYDNGILCTVPLRAMKIYTTNLHIDTAPKLKVEVWYDGKNDDINNPPGAIQNISLHATGGLMGNLKQGYTFPVIPIPSLARYRVSLVDTNGGDTVDDSVPHDWLIEFSDPVIGNRWNPEFVQMSIQGRDCGGVADGLISSQHDRRYLSGLSVDDSAWGSHGACVNGIPQPPDMPLVNCSATSGGKAGAIATTECADLCEPPCDDVNSFCHCGTGKCEYKPGFVTASIDLCAAARCGEHGTCAARYLSDGTSPLPVTSPDHACICDEGWHGPLCDEPDPCLSSNRTCSGRGQCASLNGYVDYCDCDEGYSGDNCEVSCDGLCEGGGGVWPYGCAGYPIGTAVKYKCGPTGGCQYLEPGQDGIASWCTYMDLSSGNEHSCTCDTHNDCQIGGICNSDGTCPTPIQVVDGTPCNSKPYGTCQAGICVEPPSPAPTSEPTKSPMLTSLSPTKAPTIIASSSPTKAPTTGALVPIQPLWAEASSVRDANTANQAIDGNLGTRWESEFSDPQWISVDLGEVYSLRTIEIAWEPAYAKSYDIQVSNDGTTWSTIFSETNGNGGVDIINPAFGSSSGRFVRIYGITRGTIWGYSIWELKLFGTVSTDEPTTAPVVPPTPETCEGKCAGTGPYFNCAWWKMNDQHTRSACDPNGGGGCQYLPSGQETSWCVYQTFDTSPTPTPMATTGSPSKAPTIQITSNPTVAPVVVPSPTKPPSMPDESCEGKCAGTGPYFGCAWWKTYDLHTKSACDPSGSGACQYLQEGQTTTWCVYQTFDVPPAPNPTVAPTSEPTVSPTKDPTLAPVASPTAPPIPESCEGKCAGTGPYFGCAWWKTYELHTKSACDPTGSGGCQYLQDGQTTNWCVYQTFEVPPPTPVSTGSPSKTPTVSTLKPTVAPTSKPTVSPTTSNPTVAPVASPTTPPMPESCEGKCNGTGPYFGCAWWKMNDLHTKSACDPNGGGGCQYLQEGQTTNWCIYQQF